MNLPLPRCSEKPERRDAEGQFKQERALNSGNIFLDQAHFFGAFNQIVVLDFLNIPAGKGLAMHLAPAGTIDELHH